MHTGRWDRFIFSREERRRTTWRFRASVLVCFVVLAMLTRSIWLRGIGHSLTCAEQSTRTDAILIDNFDWDYLLFEQAARMQRAGLSTRVIVPVRATTAASGTTVEEGIVEVMARSAHLQNVEPVDVYQSEPISLSVANQIRSFFTKEGIKSVALVTPGFRSVRSVLIYQTTLRGTDITVFCVPVFGSRTPDDWTGSWHGIQEVVLQFAKLQYYRFYVLPFLA